MSKVVIFRPGERKDGDINPAQWNHVVNETNGYFTQLYEWMEMCSTTFNYESYPMLMEEGNEIRSICPMIFDPLSKELQSPPLTGIGGPLPTSELSTYLPEIEKLSKELNASKIKIQVRNEPETLHTLKQYGYNIDHIIPYYLLDLKDVKSFDEVRKKFSKAARKGYERSRKFGVEVKSSPLSSENLKLTYDIYLETMEYNKARNIIPEELFNSIGELFKDHTAIFVAERDGKIAGTAICFVSGERIKAWFIVGRIEERKTYINNAIYCAVIKYAISKGLRYVDFGPSGAFSKAQRIKTGHGGSRVWIVRAVKIRNPLKRPLYSLKKSLRKHAILKPDTKFSKFYKKHIARSR